MPEQWVKLEILFYVNSRGTSGVRWRINDGGWTLWSGQMAYWFEDVTHSRHIDMKIGVYAPPLPTDLGVYLDDIILDLFDDGVIN